MGSHTVQATMNFSWYRRTSCTCSLVIIDALVRICPMRRLTVTAKAFTMSGTMPEDSRRHSARSKRRAGRTVPRSANATIANVSRFANAIAAKIAMSPRPFVTATTTPAASFEASRNARGNGVVAGVSLRGSYAENGGWMVITTAWGLAVTCAVLVALAVGSNAHLNPAVSIALATLLVRYTRNVYLLYDSDNALDVFILTGIGGLSGTQTPHWDDDAPSRWRRSSRRAG